MKQLFNNDWHFLKTDVDTSYEQAKKRDKVPVDIPHDWLIHQTKALYETGIGWYFKSFNIKDISKVYKLIFDGVYMNTTIFLNDEEIFEWKYGYSAFEVDLTSKVKSDENSIVVRVNHQSPNSRWYSGAGIFRDIYILEKSSAHLVTDGVYFSAKVNDNITNGGWKITISNEALNVDETHKIKHTILDKNANVFTEIHSNCNTETEVLVNNPQLWNVENPNLYTLKTELLENGEVVDSFEQNIGFRKIEFTANEGFFLNDKRVKLRGVCMHHDLGSLGAAVNKNAIRRQIEIMQEMGVNSIRTSHNMPAKDFMDLCDEMGILVVSEDFDVWELKKNEFDYARFFKDWYKKDVASWVRRDRNSPSIIMWSVGNEIYDTHASKRGEEVTVMLCDEVRKHDYRMNGFTTIGSNYIEWEGAQNCAKQVDISGYNYGEYLYKNHHEKYPDWKIYGSETASRVQSRGIYHFPKKSAYLTHDDLQCSSLENCRAGNSDRTAQDSIIWDRDTEFCAGQYIWTGFDYLGEPSPYWTKNSYFGQVDTAGFKKDSFYLYQSAWTDKKVLHLMPYWDFNEGQIIDIMVYTNLYEVELFLNGNSLGRKKREKYSIDWEAKFTKGEVVAIGYDENGNEIARDSICSFGNTNSFSLKPNKTILLANGTDLAFIEIDALDSDGNFVANARDRVIVNVSGEGRLIGLDTGDSTDFDEFKGTSKRLFNGKLLAIIATTHNDGEIKINVSSKGLKSSEIFLNSQKVDVPVGASNALLKNLDSMNIDDYFNEVPVRKIELFTERTVLNKNNTQTIINAKILPENASFKELSWTIVTNSGVKTNIAELDENAFSATIKALGDGEFRLRCSSNNGKVHPDVISELEFEIKGMGRATSNPYELVAGSLYSACLNTPDEVANGGVSVTVKDKNMVGYKKLDFGKNGSDEFAIKLINWHRDNEVYFSVYKGIYGEDGAEKLGDFAYLADFVWQTYIENSFKLEQKLIGVQDISFVFDYTRDQRVYFGGFYFKQENPAYKLIKSVENDHIHGDSFEIVGDEIHHIGNNVFIEFHDVLLDKGVNSITVYGRTWNEKDSIHLKISDENGENKTILEFEKTDEIIEKTFPLKNIEGVKKVRLEFLPGCDFDFMGFRFNA